MNYQQRTNWCGPASVQNCLLIFGDRASQKDIAEVAGTSKDGTDEAGMIRALERFRRNGVFKYHKVVREHRSSYLYDFKHFPSIICVDRWQHWMVAVASTYVGGVLVIDPARTAYNKARNGVWHVCREKLILKMRPPPGELEAYYWIEVY